MVRASIVECVQRRDNTKRNIPPSASMTPAATETFPPEKMTNGISRMPMQDTGRTQQYLRNEPNVFMTFTCLILPGNNAAPFIYLSHLHRIANAATVAPYLALFLSAP